LWLEVEAPPSLPNRCLHLAQRAGAGLSFDGTFCLRLERRPSPTLNARIAFAQQPRDGRWFDSRCCATLWLAIGILRHQNGRWSEWTHPVRQDKIGASTRFRPYRKTFQSTSTVRMSSRTVSAIPNTNAQVPNSSTVALLCRRKGEIIFKPVTGTTQSTANVWSIF